MKEKRTVAMPPRESLRPVTNTDVDEYVWIRASRGVRFAKGGGRAPIDDSEISWDDVPARRSRRRHPVAAADDWGLAESDPWAVEPQPASERSSSTREQARRERSAQTARAELAGDWEAEHRLTDDWAPWEPEDRSTGEWSPWDPEDRSTGEWSPWEPEDRSTGEWSPWGSPPAPDLADVAAEATTAEPDLGPHVYESEGTVARIDHSGADITVSAAVTDDIWGVRSTVPGARRTIVITGRGAEGQPPRRRGWEASLPLHERSGFKPDRVAMWAVLLGVILLLVAAASSHAAILATHLAH